SPRANRDKAYPRFNFQLTASTALVPVRTAHVLPTQAITIDVGQTAEIEVKNGNGYELWISSPRFDYEPTARLIVPGLNEPVRSCKINGDSVLIKIKGIFWGNAILVAHNYDLGPKFNETLVVNVRDPRPNNYHPTNAHHHEPVKEPDDWNKVCEEAAK